MRRGSGSGEVELDEVWCRFERGGESEGVVEFAKGREGGRDE